MTKTDHISPEKIVVASQGGGTRTFFGAAEASAKVPMPPVEGMTGFVAPNADKLLWNKIAPSSIHTEMTDNVQTTDRPVVVMVAPRQIFTTDGSVDFASKSGNGDNGGGGGISTQLEKISVN